MAILDLDGMEAETTAAGLPVPGMALACDVAVEADADKAVQLVVERLGGLDIVVNNAHGVFLEVVKRGVPRGREQTPADIGQLAAFLVGDTARNISGQWIAADGGITLRQAL